jgi:hypothetical protein
MAEHVFDTYDDQTPHLNDDAKPTDPAREPRQLDPNKPRRGGQRKRNTRPTEMSIGGTQPHDPQAELAQLESQGFTPDEAARLIYISDRLAHSREAREAEAVMRRLRFHRWLVESGRLDEFSA